MVKIAKMPEKKRSPKNLKVLKITVLEKNFLHISKTYKQSCYKACFSNIK